MVSLSDVDQQLSALDNKVIDLEGEKERLQNENAKLQASVEVSITFAFIWG